MRIPFLDGLKAIWEGDFLLFGDRKNPLGSQSKRDFRATMILINPEVTTIFGTPEGTRTPNPRNRNPMLYPLSHRRICFIA